ncbi:hypothetical protein EJB05_40168 [Eragrostis curvula]|uniref:Uncharacterized protein n=1 Tax=Eragrostis curvula TaxID=38414 RepID=A0A5J9TZ37_9POAL|nr:hypothetical protein EJB05_40168 [Eragrostis curvula]
MTQRLRILFLTVTNSSLWQPSAYAPWATNDSMSHLLLCKNSMQKGKAQKHDEHPHDAILLRFCVGLLAAEPVIASPVHQQCKANDTANDTLAIIILYLQNHAQNSSDSLPSVVMALCLLLLDTSSNPVNKYLGDNRGTIEMLCSKIRCPAECKPCVEMVWALIVNCSNFMSFSCGDTSARKMHNRYSIVFSNLRHYYQPWKDPAMQKTEVERMEEEQACRTKPLLIIFSNAFSSGVSDFLKLSLNDVEKCGLFQWERESMIN